MSSTNKTTNYELSQFIETDRPAWLTDYNSDMRKIDSNLKEVSEIAGGASGSISALADRMSAAEGNITTNTNDIDALEARADSLEAQAQSTAGTIANIQTEQTAQNLGIEAATELGYNLARPYDSASTYAVGDYVLFQNTLYKCVTAVSTGEAFDPTKWLAVKATDEFAGDLTLTHRSSSNFINFSAGTTTSQDITFTNAVCRPYSSSFDQINNLMIMNLQILVQGITQTQGVGGTATIRFTGVPTVALKAGSSAVSILNMSNRLIKSASLTVDSSGSSCRLDADIVLDSNLSNITNANVVIIVSM